MNQQRGMVLHIAAGYYEGTIAWQRNNDADVSSHFIVAGPRDAQWGVPDGKIAQMVDTDTAAWTQRDGNGEWMSIEFSGFVGDPLSAKQLEAAALLFARGHLVYGYPLQLATSPSGRGLGHHSMGAESGANWGHSECPGAPIKNQKPAILARAIEIAGGDMALMDDPDFAALAYRVHAISNDLPTVAASAVAGEENKLHTRLGAIQAQIDALAIASGLDPAALQAAVQAGIQAETPAIAAAVADEHHARLAG